MDDLGVGDIVRLDTLVDDYEREIYKSEYLGRIGMVIAVHHLTRTEKADLIDVKFSDRTMCLEPHQVCIVHQSRKNRQISRKPRKTKSAWKVVCIETNTIYNSAKEASTFTGANINRIRRCCRGDAHTTGGYHWKYMK